MNLNSQSCLIEAHQITTHNVLAHADLNVPIDLKRAVRVLNNAEYDPEKFQSVRVRFFRENALISVFSTGKIQATGVRTAQDARLCMKRVAFRLKKYGEYPELRFSNFRVENALATVDVDYLINLQGLSCDRSVVCMYEPSRFAAAVIRDLDDTKATIDVFASGKINVKAPGGVDIMLRALNKAMPVISKYRVGDY